VIHFKTTRPNLSIASFQARLKASTISQHTLLLLLNSLVNGLGGIGFWFVAARFYSPAIVGIATAGTSMIVLLATVSQFGLGMGMIRYASALGPRRRQWLGAIWAVTILGAVIAGGLFGQLAPLIAPGLLPLFRAPVDATLFVGACITWAISILFDSYLVSQRRMDLMVIDNSLTALCRIVLVAAVPHASAAMLIAGTGLSGLVGVVAVLPALLRQSAAAQASSAAVSFRGFLSYSLWNYWIAITSMMTTLALPSIIISFTDGVQTAAYYMAWSLFSGLTMVPSALAQVLLVSRAHSAAASESTPRPRQRHDLLMLLLALVFIPLALGILALLGKSYFSYGWLIVLILAVGYWPNYRALLLQTEMRLVGSQQVLAFIYTASYAATLGLSIPLLVALGAPGAALAWALGQCLLYALLTWGLRRYRAVQPT
jgi:O-antigen/teichoic acid export membrane protein